MNEEEEAEERRNQRPVPISFKISKEEEIVPPLPSGKGCRSRGDKIGPFSLAQDIAKS